VNEVLKQRLVGALILLALGVIFWPIIFVGPGGEEAARHTEMPPVPAVPTDPLEAPGKVGLRTSPPAIIHQEQPEVEPAPLPVPVPMPEPEEPAPDPTGVPSEQPEARSEAPEKLALDADGVPIAWILQVASVSSQDKADGLAKQLLDMGHKAYVEHVKRDGKSLYRVYIGPKHERARLESMRADIDAAFGVQSMIRRYVP
jgi:DedD protein